MKKYVVCLSLVISMCLGGSAFGSNIWGGANPGDWSVAGNWGAGVLPGVNGDGNIILQSGVCNLTVNYTPPITLTYLQVRYGATLNIGANLSNVTELRLGEHDKGTINQTAGTFTINPTGAALIGRSGTPGTKYNLSGGTLITLNDIQLGAGGLMDISGFGKLIVSTAKAGVVDGYITAGKVTGNGVAGWTNLVKTTVGSTVEYTAIPEPATLFVLGMGGLALLRKKRN